MSDDSLLPPGHSAEEEALDADEAAEASALAQALEGRSGTPALPGAALETAALLRYSGAAGQLSEQRRAALREQVLASVPAGSLAARSPRNALWRWLGLGVPLVGAAAGLWLVIGAFQRAAEPELSRYAERRDGPTEHAEESANTASAPSPGAAAPADEWAAQGSAASDTVAREKPALDQALRERAAPQAEAEASPNAVAFRGEASRSRAAASGAAPRATAPRAFAADELGAPRAEPAAPALPFRLAAAPSAASSAGPGGGERGSGAGLGAAEAKRSASPGAPSGARLEGSSQRYRMRLLPRLGDTRVDQAYAALDRAQSNAELRQAQTNLTALSSGTLGSADESAVSELMRQDIFCRLAEVALRLGQPDVALDWTRRGLELQAPPNPFAARLWHVDGRARAALGDQDGAARSYLKAIEVNERLLDENLEGEP